MPAGSRQKSDSDTVIEILGRRDGKDKTAKIIQYFSKLILRFRTVPQLEPLVGQLSLFRRILKCGEWLSILQRARSNENIDWLEALSVLNGISDDLEFLAKIGTLDRRNERQYATWAKRFWLLVILLNLRVILRWRDNTVDAAKLSCDLVFCIVDLWFPNVDPIVQIATGLGSASLAYYKIWRKTR